MSMEARFDKRKRRRLSHAARREAASREAESTRSATVRSIC